MDSPLVLAPDGHAIGLLLHPLKIDVVSSEQAWLGISPSSI
jgi:hypothetical protein